MTEKVDMDTVLGEALGLPRWMAPAGEVRRVALYAAKRINSLTQQRDQSTKRRDHWFKEREKELDENEQLRKRIAELDDYISRVKAAWQRYEDAEYLSDDEAHAEGELYALMEEAP